MATVTIPKDASREVQMAIKLLLEHINRLEAKVAKLEKG